MPCGHLLLLLFALLLVRYYVRALPLVLRLQSSLHQFCCYSLPISRAVHHESAVTDSVRAVSIQLLFMAEIGRKGRVGVGFCDFLFASRYLFVNPKVSPRPPNSSCPTG